MKKKLLSTMIVAAMMTTMLAGCGSEPGGNGQDGGEGQSSVQQSENTGTPAVGDDNTGSADDNTGNADTAGGSDAEVGDLGSGDHRLLEGYQGGL